MRPLDDSGHKLDHYDIYILHIIINHRVCNKIEYWQGELPNLKLFKRGLTDMPL